MNYLYYLLYRAISPGIIGLAFLALASHSSAQPLSTPVYDIGTPDVTEIWVDPVSGDDSRAGNSRESALRTVTAAWNRIPTAQTLSTGYRIMITSGSVPSSALPNYWESKWGSFARPIILQAADGQGTVTFRGGPNVFDCRYLYILDINLIPDPAGDAFHCERCNHVLIRGAEISGGNRQAHETIKVNQSSYIYLEDNNIHGADDNAVDFVAVQYGHVARNQIHDAADWCIYAKGGSAQILFEANRIYNCGTGGFTAGQGTGFEFMESPWLHYEAYDLKFINNIITDTEGAGMGVNGGYNILLAHNTLYRVGSRSHLLEVVFGLRSCDGNAGACNSRRTSGGWGPGFVTSDGDPIPNRNVFIYNNVFYNPAGFKSLWQQFAIHGPRSPRSGTNIPSPATTDVNLRIRGNVILNDQESLGLGEDSGCQDSNPTCNEAQLLADNTINSITPELRDVTAGDFRPTEGSNLFSATTFSIPDFPGGDRETPPLAPQGNLSNLVSRDRSGAARSSSSPPGAFATHDATLDPVVPPVGDTDSPPQISSIRLSPRQILRGGTITVTAIVSDDNTVSSVRAVLGGRSYAMRLSDGRYRARVRIRNRLSGRVSIRARDDAGQLTSRRGPLVTVR